MRFGWMQMKILMFGRGVINATYGWALQTAGHSVDYYVRPNRVQEYGDVMDVQIHDTRRGFFSQHVHEAMPINCREDIAPDHDYDLIILSVQHYNFEQAAKTVATFVGDATVMIFNNFWAEPAEATSMLPADQLVWGFPAAGGGIENNTLRAILINRVTFGALDRPMTRRDRTVRDLFRDSGFKIGEVPDIRAWLFIHFVMIAGMQSEWISAGKGVKPSLSLRTFYNAMLNSKELIPVLTARDVDIKAHTSAMVFRLPAMMTSVALWLTFKFVAPIRNVVEWHSNPAEMLHTCLDVLTEAQRLGIAVPRLEANIREYRERAASSDA